MGRVYTATMPPVSVSAARDLIVMTAPATGMFKLLSAFAGQDSLAGDSNANMNVIGLTRYATEATGTANTPTPHNVGHAATGVTVTTNAAQGTTPTIVLAETFNIQAGWYYAPIPEEMVWCAPSADLTVELHEAPLAAQDMTARATFEEFD